MRASQFCAKLRIRLSPRHVSPGGRLRTVSFWIFGFARREKCFNSIAHVGNSHTLSKSGDDPGFTNDVNSFRVHVARKYSKLKIRKHGASRVPDTARFATCVPQAGGSVKMFSGIY